MDTPAPYGLTVMKFLWEQYAHTISFTPVPKDAWLDEFFFCLLGGYGIPFELNQSAFNVVRMKGYLNRDTFQGCAAGLSRKLETEFRTRQFTPLCKDGTFRRYRFPRRKAKILVEAGRWLLQTCDFHLADLLGSNPRQNRDVLLRCPGFGYKTASWFLRNIGLGSRLAILDVHVYRTLKEFAIIPPALRLESDYLEIERSFCDACQAIGAEAARMDLVLWEWSRGGVYEQMH